jgi:hypothetical protein
LSYLALPFTLSPQEGAAMSVYLATSAACVSGKYFTGGKVAHVRNRHVPFGSKTEVMILHGEVRFASESAR